MPTLAQLDAAAALVHEVMPPTPEIAWPLLATRVGAEVWVKHENHTPIGAFKLRGGLVYMADLRTSEPAIQGVISATRGNHGQSRSEEHTSELQSRVDLVCRLLLEKKKNR